MSKVLKIVFVFKKRKKESKNLGRKESISEKSMVHGLTFKKVTFQPTSKITNKYSKIKAFEEKKEFLGKCQSSSKPDLLNNAEAIIKNISLNFTLIKV